VIKGIEDEMERGLRIVAVCPAGGFLDPGRARIEHGSGSPADGGVPGAQ